MTADLLVPFRECTRCLRPFPATLEHFPPHKGGKYGLHPNCRPCKKLIGAELRARPDQAERQKRWRDSNKARVKQYNQSYRAAGYKSTSDVRAWRERNLERSRSYGREKMRRRRAENPGKYSALARAYYYRNHEKVLERSRAYAKKNRAAINSRAAKRLMALYRTNPGFNLKMKVSARLRRMVFDKAGRVTEAILGYTRKELVAHIERQFTKGMTWEKLLKGQIHIDHIIPVSKFQYASVNDPDFKACWSLGNLRPLWAKDNLSKQDKVLTLL